MNVELLRKIKDKILEQPENFQMHDWHCGTAHCIAGWAQMLTRGSTHAFEDAIKALDLLDEQALRLFHEPYWPPQFQEPCLTSGQYAKQAAKRLEFFIATNGTDRE